MTWTRTNLPSSCHSGLRHISDAETLARRPHGLLGRQPEAEVVGARKLRGDRLALRQRQLRAIVRRQDKQVLVVVTRLIRPKCSA